MRPTSTPSGSFLFLAPVPLVELSNSGGDYALIYFLLLWVGCRAFFSPLIILITSSKGRGMKGVYLWNPLWFIRYFLKCVEYWIRTIGAHLQANWGAGEGKQGWQVDNGKILRHLEGRGYFLPNKDARNDQNTELNAMKPKNSLILCVNTSKEPWMEIIQAGGALQGTCRRCSTSRPSVDPKFQLLQRPWDLWPTGNIPLSLSLPPGTVSLSLSQQRHPTDDVPVPSQVFGDGELITTGSLSLSCIPGPKNIPAKMVPMETMELQSFIAHISDKVVVECFPYLF